MPITGMVMIAFCLGMGFMLCCWEINDCKKRKKYNEMILPIFVAIILIFLLFFWLVPEVNERFVPVETQTQQALFYYVIIISYNFYFLSNHQSVLSKASNKFS